MWHHGGQPRAFNTASAPTILPAPLAANHKAEPILWSMTVHRGATNRMICSCRDESNSGVTSTSTSLQSLLPLGSSTTSSGHRFSPTAPMCVLVRICSGTVGRMASSAKERYPVSRSGAAWNSEVPLEVRAEDEDGGGVSLLLVAPPPPKATLASSRGVVGGRR